VVLDLVISAHLNQTSAKGVFSIFLFSYYEAWKLYLLLTLVYEEEIICTPCGRDRLVLV
jgi:hypothetical protein